ncbi:hypothetical protein QYE76_050166 [Lolium multiflorum]|uniref:Uncharacterized protein n=1 Tax=Lolium multiflorum TaxID=4521 RepID=A0AAD8SPF3_LOLMU|nr:hypothetical protein QYE76_050166 [Lolium multiflorum]
MGWALGTHRHRPFAYIFLRLENPNTVDDIPRKFVAAAIAKPSSGDRSVPARRRDGEAPESISIDSIAIFIAVAVSHDEEGVVLHRGLYRFKKQGKPKKGNFKKGSKKVAAPPEKPKAGPKPDTECYYCKEKGHWKRNFPKYMADLKSGLVKKKKDRKEANDNDHETLNKKGTSQIDEGAYHS